VGRHRMSKISISIGPGQYGNVIVDMLSRTGRLNQTFWSYPELAVETFGLSEEQRIVSRSFGILQRAAWAAWRRLPYYGEFQTPTGYLLPLADSWISKRLEPCDVFVGWQQVSLRSLKKAKRLGARTVLEHQTSSTQAWMQLILEEYRIWKEIGTGAHALFSERQIEQMENEYFVADQINVLSTFSKKTLVDQGIDSAKIRVAPFGVDTCKFKPSSSRKSKPLRILYVGRLELLKGVQYLLEAFTKIPRKDVTLDLVGPVLPEFRNVLAKFRDDRINVRGAVEHSQLPDIYANSDVFVFPSVNDGFGLVVLEAMASGLPVIASTNSCAYDVISENENGFVIPIRDSNAIKERLEILFENPEELMKLGRNARRTVIESFTLDHYETRLLTSYA
jgi:glycosyltransferase involved in cell wall biosynthesis